MKNKIITGEQPKWLYDQLFPSSVQSILRKWMVRNSFSKSKCGSRGPSHTCTVYLCDRSYRISFIHRTVLWSTWLTENKTARSNFMSLEEMVHPLHQVYYDVWKGFVEIKIRITNKALKAHGSVLLLFLLPLNSYVHLHKCEHSDQAFVVISVVWKGFPAPKGSTAKLWRVG